MTENGLRKTVTLCLSVPYDIVQTNKKGECDICVVLDVDVDAGADVIIGIMDAAGATIAGAAATITAAAAAATITGASTISVPAKGARLTEKASAMDTGKASTTPDGEDPAGFHSPAKAEMA